jgi:hypothetical protein
MRELVTQAKRDGRIRKLSIAIVKSCQNKNFHCYAQAIHQWIVDNIKYLHDPPGVETLVAPWLMLEHRGGDCDDHVMLFAAVCEAAGLPARFATIKADPSSPSEYSHVFSQVFLEGKWVTSDTTMPQHPFGWDPGAKYERRTWPASFDKAEFPESEVPMIGRLNRLGRFGASAEEQKRVAELTVGGVMSGDMARELGQARRDIGDRQADLQAMLKAVNGAPPERQGPLFDMWNRANAQMKREQASLQATIQKYDELARTIQTWSRGKMRPPQLGVAPVVALGVGAAAVVAAAWAFYTVMGAWRGDANANKGYLTQLSDALSSAGVAMEKTGAAAFNFGMLALIAGGGFLLYQVLKKRGTI